MEPDFKPGDIIDVKGFNDEPSVVLGQNVRRNGLFRVVSVNGQSMRVEAVGMEIPETCGDCDHYSSDCDQGGVWYICAHDSFPIEGRGTELATAPPEWCPLRNGSTKEEDDDGGERDAN